MTVLCFKGKSTRKRHEYVQLKEICNIISNNWPNELFFVLTNFRLNNIELDCVILRKEGPIILELKSYCGEVRGNENQDKWEVITPEGEIVELPNNVFDQIRKEREDLRERLSMIYKKRIPRISISKKLDIPAWGYFESGSYYPEGQINLKKAKYFRIVTKENLIEEMEQDNASYSLFPEDFEIIVEELGLEKYDIPISNSNIINFEDVWKKIINLSGEFISPFTGNKFTFTVNNDILSIDGTEFSFQKNIIREIYNYGPRDRPTDYPDISLQSGHIWAILHNKRILES
jgi:hypothetical protein